MNGRAGGRVSISYSIPAGFATDTGGSRSIFSTVAILTLMSQRLMSTLTSYATGGRLLVTDSDRETGEKTLTVYAIRPAVEGM